MEKIKVDVGKVSTSPQTINSMIQESRGRAKESKRNNFRPHGTIYLEDIIKWIKKQEYDTYTEKELIKIVSGYPQGALRRFFSTINNHIATIQKNKRQETSGGQIHRKQPLDINALDEEKRKSALKQRMLARSAFEEQKKKEELQQESQQLQEEPQVQESKQFPQKQQSEEPPPEQVMRSMDFRRKFAQRLSEITQDQEATDEEWLKNV